MLQDLIFVKILFIFLKTGILPEIIEEKEQKIVFMQMISFFSGIIFINLLI